MVALIFRFLQFYHAVIVIFQIRIGWVLEAMRLHLQMVGEESDIENLSPYQVRQLLQRVLTVSQWASEEKYLHQLDSLKVSHGLIQSVCILG